MQTWRDGRRNKRKDCHRITCKDYEGKERIHEGKEKVKEQYIPTNTNIWITNLDMEHITGHISQECILWKSVI